MIFSVNIAGRALAAAALGLATIALAAPASALVRYEFTALSSFPINGEAYSGGFTYTSPDFITSFRTVQPADLVNATLIGSVSGALPIEASEFLPNFFGGDAVGFGFQPGGVIYYYFPLGAFIQPGTYKTIVFGDDQAGRLVVTDLGGGNGGGVVPEPASWAMLIAGFGLVGGAIRRRRATAIANA